MNLLGNVNTLITAPFRTKLPLMPIVLTLFLALIVAFQWRLIVDRIDEIEEEI
jgi:hypothetical protein